MNVNKKMSAFMEKHFADRLQAEGFISYRNNMRHWYKLVDKSVLQTVILDYCGKTAGILNLWYGSVPLYVPFPIPYCHSVDMMPYVDILKDAYADYWGDGRCALTYDPLGNTGKMHYEKVVEIFQAAMNEFIFPSFAQIHDLVSCHAEWWTEKQQQIANMPPSTDGHQAVPYYSDTRGIWELLFGHHKKELDAYIQIHYAKQCRFLGESVNDMHLPESWRADNQVLFARAKRIIHNSETDNWDDLDLMVQENMQQMRELVRKKLKL